ncbi:MAG: ribosome small subunit-dependent GTPase A [Thermoguttaceae bacterium]|nr:ribosome small subunit-dependent GTPase A [Thermoguttaceae bacterium]
MAKKKPGGGKIRINFRKNRQARTRQGNLARQCDAQALESEEGLDVFDTTVSSERLSGRGSLTRRRTVVGQRLAEEHASGERGDFVVLPEVNRQTLKGRVRVVYGLHSTVEAEDGRLFTCVTRRVLKTIATEQRQVVVAGDRVHCRDAMNPDQHEGIIELVEPRFGSLSRTSRRRKHIMVTNVDQAVIVASAAMPTLKPNLIDRILVTCDRAGIAPIICINKIDLVDPAPLMPLVGVYAQMGYKTALVSTKTGFGIDALRRCFQDKETVIVGQSGVGKSSLLNAVDDHLSLRVGTINAETQKGKHTTTTAELLRLSFGGWVVDTPGIRQFALWDIIPEEVIGFYRDLRPYENLCHYPDCTHTHEHGCAVNDAVADGRLDTRRYESYLALRAGEMET